MLGKQASIARKNIISCKIGHSEHGTIQRYQQKGKETKVSELGEVTAAVTVDWLRTTFTADRKR
jgi:hypothetical protein